MMRAGRQTSPPSGKAELQGHDDTGLGPLHNQGVQDNHWDRGEVLCLCGLLELWVEHRMPVTILLKNLQPLNLAKI